MKKYIKPELNVENVLLNSELASTISGNLAHVNNFGNDAGTTTWTDLFGE